MPRPFNRLTPLALPNRRYRRRKRHPARQVDALLDRSTDGIVMTAGIAGPSCCHDTTV